MNNACWTTHYMQALSRTRALFNIIVSYQLYFFSNGDITRIWIYSMKNAWVITLLKSTHALPRGLSVVSGPIMVLHDISISKPYMWCFWTIYPVLYSGLCWYLSLVSLDVLSASSSPDFLTNTPTHIKFMTFSDCGAEQWVSDDVAPQSKSIVHTGGFPGSGRIKKQRTADCSSIFSLQTTVLVSPCPEIRILVGMASNTVVVLPNC